MRFTGVLCLLLAGAVSGCRQANRVAQAAEYRSASAGGWPLGLGTKPRSEPSDGEMGLARYLQGLLSEVRGDMKEAAAIYSQAHVTDPQSVQILLRLGLSQLRIDDLEAALQSFEKAAHLDPSDPRARFLLGVLYTNMERFEEAADQYSRILKEDPEHLGALSQLADLYVMQEKVNEGVDVYEKLLKERPDSPVAHFNVGVLYAKSQRWDEAVRHMRQAIDLDPGYLEARMGLAVSLELGGQPDLARDEFLKAIEQEPLNTQLIHYLARLSYRLGDLEGASQWLTRYLSFQPRDPNGLLELAYILIEQKQWKPAVQHLEAGLGVGASADVRVDLYIALGICREAMGEPAAAEQAYRGAMAAGPDEAQPGLHLASLFHSAGRMEAAEQVLQEAFQRRPDDPDILNSLGYLYADWGKNLEEAVRLLERALAQDPQNAAYLDSLGWAYFKMGRFDDAVRSLDDSLARDPDAEVHEHLGHVYLMKGDLESAKQAWRDGLKLGSRDPLVIERIKSQLNKLQNRKDR